MDFRGGEVQRHSVDGQRVYVYSWSKVIPTLRTLEPLKPEQRGC
jgi:hypothetical protein